MELPKMNKLEELVESYGQHLTNQGKVRSHVLGYVNPSKQFIRFLHKLSIHEPKEVEGVHLEDFQRFLYEERDFKRASVVTFVKCINFFFDFLVEKGELDHNLTRDVEVLSPSKLPDEQLSHFYTYEEILRRYLVNQKRWISYGYWNQVKKHLDAFVKYLLSNEIVSIYKVTESTVIGYRNYLWEELVDMKDTALVTRSQIVRLQCVVRLFRYLRREGILNKDPAEKLGWEAYYKELKEKAKNIPTKRPEEKRELTEFETMRIKFLEYELGKGKSPKTVKTYKKGLQILFDFLEEKGIHNLAQVNKRMLLEYFTFVCNYVGVRGASASNGYKNHMIWSMKLFFSYLIRFEYLRTDPSYDIEMIKEQSGLPHTCMSEEEIKKLLEKPLLDTSPLTLRDKAILEVLFATAIRANELCCLDMGDIDYQGGLIRINTPKGGASFQRVVPIGEAAIKYLKIYLRDARPVLQRGDPKALFVSYSGRRLNNEGVLNVVKKYVFECGIKKHITTHSFRVTCATLMLKNGADIRYVQEQLGHKRITSTQKYTRLQPVDLKAIYRKCHPRERDMARERALEEKEARKK